jgi:hypothetical protein
MLNAQALEKATRGMLASLTRWLEPGGGQLSKLSWAQNPETRTKP